VVRRLDAAAAGGSADDVSIALQMAFQWSASRTDSCTATIIFLVTMKN
jgi:hypothetical protein